MIRYDCLIFTCVDIIILAISSKNLMLATPQLIFNVSGVIRPQLCDLTESLVEVSSAHSIAFAWMEESSSMERLLQQGSTMRGLPFG